MRVRTKLDHGYADHDLTDMTRVGDKLVARTIDVHFLGVGELPELRMRIEVRRGVPVVTSVTIEAKHDGREVRTSDMRAVRLELWVEDIVAATAMDVATTADGGTVATKRAGEDAHRAAVSTVRATRRGGAPRKVTDEFLQGVADLYREHVDDRPTTAIQDAYVVEYRTAARYVQQARARGFLPKTSQGKRKA